MLSEHRIDTVLDVGANEGQYGLFLRELGYAGRIVSFEPLSAPYERLRRSAARDAWWTVAPRTALGNQEGAVRVNVALNNGASSSILPMLEAHRLAAPDANYVGSEMAPMSRLDRAAAEFFTEAKNIFLKLDVQGYELPVLQGASELLTRICGVQLELSFLPLYEGQALFPEMAAWMQRAGFGIWGVVPGFLDNSKGRLLQADVIFFRE